MKKWFTILCTLICAFSLTACTMSASDQEIAQQRQEIQNYKVQTLKDNAGYYTSLIQYLADTQYAIMANYSNEEIEAYVYSEYQASVDGHGLKTVMESFHLSKASTGAIKTNEDDGSPRIKELQVEENGNQLILHAKADCEKGEADLELIFSNDLFLKLEGGSLNAKASMGDLMAKAGLNTLIGMSTVFIVLILISLIIACFGLIPKIQNAFAKKEEEKQVNTDGINNAVTQIAQQEEVLEEYADDSELVAVIAAAIAAYEGSTNTEGFVVRSIRRR